ncbi:MAG: zinc ribbon domain-containing protein [Candidatus Pacearchaeota archaeon]|jgi:hypothetical protein
MEEEHPINQKTICQSCGMPMKKEKDFGKNANGTQNYEYCCFCFRNGRFTDEGITLQEKINKLVRISVEQLGLKENLARTMAETKLPQLKRWKNN